MFRTGETVQILLLTAVLCVMLISISKNDGKMKDETVGMGMGGSNIHISMKGGDDRYSMAPRPQRVWDNGPEIPTYGRGPLDPIATRGAPQSSYVWKG